MARVEETNKNFFEFLYDLLVKLIYFDEGLEGLLNQQHLKLLVRNVHLAG